MEARAGPCYWGREVVELGHEVRLLQAVYVKPFLNRRSRKSRKALCKPLAEAISHSHIENAIPTSFGIAGFSR